jgi:hypothetical protein
VSALMLILTNLIKQRYIKPVMRYTMMGRGVSDQRSNYNEIYFVIKKDKEEI